MPSSQAPSPWIVRFLPLTAPGSTALDLAAGSGRHSRLLLAHGLAVTALDREPRLRGVLCLFEGVVAGAADGYARSNVIDLVRVVEP